MRTILDFERRLRSRLEMTPAVENVEMKKYGPSVSLMKMLNESVMRELVACLIALMHVRKALV